MNHQMRLVPETVTKSSWRVSEKSITFAKLHIARIHWNITLIKPNFRPNSSHIHQRNVDNYTVSSLQFLHCTCPTSIFCTSRVRPNQLIKNSWYGLENSKCARNIVTGGNMWETIDWKMQQNVPLCARFESALFARPFFRGGSLLKPIYTVCPPIEVELKTRINGNCVLMGCWRSLCFERVHTQIVVGRGDGKLLKTCSSSLLVSNSLAVPILGSHHVVTS